MIPIEEQKIRDFYVKTARLNFEKALALDEAYIQESINLASTLVAVGDYQRLESIADLSSGIAGFDDQSSAQKLIILKPIDKMSKRNKWRCKQVSNC